jgi:SWI/SNF-related matrix-associated actin-dependent regulator of chromatin subfamily A3
MCNPYLSAFFKWPLFCGPRKLKPIANFYYSLNITIASRIHILEPQWNPAVERQAIGRILRLGQDKRITIIRYITNSTVEEVIYVECLLVN